MIEPKNLSELFGPIDFKKFTILYVGINKDLCCTCSTPGKCIGIDIDYCKKRIMQEALK